MQRKIPKENLKKLAKFHALLTISLFSLYILLSAIYSPAFLFSDVRNKYQAIADETIILMAKVLGPPNTPSVSILSSCSGNILSNSLDWTDDENSQTFNISRDGIPLITGLTNSEYTDNNITISTTYVYTVTAIGEMGPGFAVSNPSTITTLTECGELKPDPILKVTSFETKSLGSYGGNIETKETKPLFSGTTNIPNAIITIYLKDSTIIFSEIVANANGYWSWRSPTEISIGKHTLIITAKDPLDLTRSVTTNLIFEIKKEDDSEKKKTDKESQEDIIKKPTTPVSPEEQSPEEIEKNLTLALPFDFALSLKDKIIFQNKELFANIRIEKIIQSQETTNAKINYTILDLQGNEIYEISEGRELENITSFTKNIRLQKYFENGPKKLRVTIHLPGYILSKEVFFEIKPLPIVYLGGGFIATYPEILSNLGTIALTLFALSSFWFFLFSREYWLYLHSLRHITERSLLAFEFFSYENRNRRRR